jgi:hypothetical protein
MVSASQITVTAAYQSSTPGPWAAGAPMKKLSTASGLLVRSASCPIGFAAAYYNEDGSSEADAMGVWPNTTRSTGTRGILQSGEMSFQKTVTNGVARWTGHPNCQAAHDWLLQGLKTQCLSFRPTGTILDNNLQGNLGEFIAFFIGANHDYSTARAFAANAFAPLAANSKPEIDIVWLHFDASPENDFAVIQEAKTTVQSTLSYADALLGDYDKLFGTNMRLTLWTRLDGIKNELEYKLKRPDLIDRILRLAGKSPQTCTGIHLAPTLIHDLGCKADPFQKMIAIRTALVGKGWSQKVVLTWAVALSDLASRLVRLATGNR